MARATLPEQPSLLDRLHSPMEWAVFGVIALVVCVAIPVLNGLDPSSALHVPDYAVATAGKFLCYAMAAIALDLVWGYVGILSLGHGVFFALGGYAMGMYLMLEIAGEGVYRSKLPDFMVFLDWKALPWFWHGFDNFFFAIAMALFVPGFLAFILGYFAFRSKIRGVYFSIITQALTFALMLLFFRNETGFGGNNGLTDFKRIYGYPLHQASTRTALYAITAVALLLSYLLCRFTVTSKAGRVLRAIRDAEGRVVFAGYDPTRYKLFVWTLSGALCGLAGALYTPQVGIINPSEMQPSNSIEMAIWVALGGRGTLVGAAAGAFVVNAAKSYFTVAFPDLWLFVLGGLFIMITLLVPDGLIHTLTRLLPSARSAT